MQDVSSIHVEIRVSHYDGRWSAAAQVDVSGEHDRVIPPMSADALSRGIALERVVTRVIEEVELFTTRESVAPLAAKVPVEFQLDAQLTASGKSEV